MCVFVCSEGGKVWEKGRGKMKGRFGKRTYSSGKVFILKLDVDNLFPGVGGGTLCNLIYAVEKT